MELPAAIRPRYETPAPPGVTGSYGPRVIGWARRQLGITYGAWQQYALQQLLRHNRTGDLIARIALLSTGRQNGKSAIVRGVIGWLLDEGQDLAPFATWTTALAAAHDQRQARIVYRYVMGDMDNRPDQTREIRTTKFFGITAGRLEFDTVSNQPGSARGWSAGLVAWDEMLTQRDWDMWEALAPTQSAQRSPLMLLTSTAGHADSVILRAFYDRLVRQATGAEDPDPAFYGIWFQSQDPDAGLDWAELRRANPALDEGRLTREFIQGTEWNVMPPDSWKRERLNHFVDKVADAAIAPLAWAKCRLDSPLDGVDGPYALGIDVALGGSRATIAAAAVRSDGRIGVEIYRDIRPPGGQSVTSAELIAAVHSFPKPLAYIAFDKVLSAASAFERDALDTGAAWDGLSPGAMVDACMDAGEMIASGRLAIGDPLVDAQVPAVVKRDVGKEGAYRFSRGLSTEPIDAFMAAVLAAHAIAYTLRLPAVY